MNAMFKKGMLASALAVVASSALAASSVDIQVTGKIVPSSCTWYCRLWHDKCVFTEFHFGYTIGGC